MTEMLQGVLDQFKSILDISGVLPIFGSGGLFWVFLMIEVGVRLYLGSASRTLRELEPDHRQDLVKRFWVKLVLLVFFLRPLCIVSSPEDGRFNAFLLNEIINAGLVLGAFLRLRYVRSEEARFEDWTELDAAEGMVGEDRA